MINPSSDFPVPLTPHQLSEVTPAKGLQVLFDSQLIRMTRFVQENQERMPTIEVATEFAYMALTLQALYSAAETADSVDPDSTLPLAGMKAAMDAIFDLLMKLGAFFEGQSSPDSEGPAPEGPAPDDEDPFTQMVRALHQR